MRTSGIFGKILAALAGALFARLPLMRFLEQPWAMAGPGTSFGPRPRRRRRFVPPLYVSIRVAQSESPNVCDSASADLTWRPVRDRSVWEGFWIWRP